jgi:hypothetical protein
MHLGSNKLFIIIFAEIKQNKVKNFFDVLILSDFSTLAIAN